MLQNKSSQETELVTELVKRNLESAVIDHLSYLENITRANSQCSFHTDKLLCEKSKVKGLIIAEICKHYSNGECAYKIVAGICKYSSNGRCIYKDN